MYAGSDLLSRELVAVTVKRKMLNQSVPFNEETKAKERRREEGRGSAEVA